MRLYPVTEHELRTLSSVNALATVCFSAASFFATIALSIYVNAIFYTELTKEGRVARDFAVPVLGVACLFCLALAGIAIYTRHRVWASVKRESAQ